MTRLGFALGGGGARGSAHVGALEELLQLGLKPDIVTGTSIGAFVGAMVCAGFTIEQVTTALRGLRPSSMYALPDGIPSIAAPDNLEKYMVRVFADHLGDQLTERDKPRPTFQDLQIPLAVVAVDLVTQREVVLDEGDLVRALLASMTIPMLFPPVQIGEKYLVDGGIINNLPFDVARSRGATYTIAIDLGNAAPYGTQSEHPRPASEGGILGIKWEQLMDGSIFDRALFQAARDPLWQVATAVIDIVARQNVNLRLAISPPDVLIQPYIGTIGILDFHTIDDGIEAGRKAVHRAAPQIEKVLSLLVSANQSDEQAVLPETEEPKRRTGIFRRKS